ncbi:Arginase [Candidatus Bealeia paramacronuclearis]|uniref:Arginase n=1 Tax=Candidatus Bealeia paramacronuclearis TaxID=1921001 RepID=A0ABZ2C857_9PROT|nr:Arginase [Candidatus Bealeia paramacronuclearis]
MTHILHFIGAALGCGTKKPETLEGPEALYHTPFLKQLNNLGYVTSWEDTIVEHNPNKIQAGTLESLSVVHDFNHRLAHTVDDSLEQSAFPIVIGGDHSVAIGTWSGVIHHLNAEGEFGLIWLDAHMDSHTPQTTPSNCIHGMPLATLLGHGEEELTHLISPKAKLNPKHVVLIGVRSFEEGEQKLLENLNVRIMFQKEVHQRGFQACFDEALEIAQKGTKGFGVTLDLDMFDPRFAPGVGVPETDGALPTETLPALQGLIQNPNFKAFEVVELNPTLDRDDITLTLLQDIIASVLQKS